MSEKEIIERLSAKMADKWGELADKLDEFTDTLSSEIPPMIVVIAFLSKASDVALDEDWIDEETFMKMASMTYYRSRETLADSASVH